VNIGFAGLGKLGLPVALAIESKGHSVVAHDPAEGPRQILQIQGGLSIDTGRRQHAANRLVVHEQREFRRAVRPAFAHASRDVAQRRFQFGAQQFTT
jgi:3-hydroxyisobutyrate dehydrogenase-like beta-hydroxyacid dehydrogenase